jgi:hypothetical protein
VLKCEAAGARCALSKDCAWYERCVNEQCVPAPVGLPCAPDEWNDPVLYSNDCGPGSYCKDCACARRPLIPYGYFDPERSDEPDCIDVPPLATCPENQQCVWEVLDSYYCKDSLPKEGEQCLIQNKCAAGLYCAQTKYDVEPHPHCYKQAQLGEPCVSAEPQGCAPGLSCDFELCQPAEAPLGAACEANISMGYPPSLSPREITWSAPRACKQGTYCADTGNLDAKGHEIGKCSALKPIGSACGNSWECDNGICEGGKCKAPAMGTPCGCDGVCQRLSSYCPPGSACDGSQCVTALKQGDTCHVPGSACGPGTTCVESDGKWACQNGAHLDQPCDGYACVDPGTACIHVPL